VARLPSLLDPPIAFAHRGASAHEQPNTLEAFRLGLRLGATGLESDVWLTADGVPVLDHDGMRILETTAIARYLNDVLPGKSLVPTNPKDRARMDMIISILDSYGYGALIGGVAAYHLFPDFVGGKNDAMRKGGIENGRKVIELAMKTKGSSPYIAGELSLADLYLAPVAFYVSLTPDKDAVFDVDGFADWWAKIEALQSFKVTQPNLG